jgi:hypothetical protein
MLNYTNIPVTIAGTTVFATQANFTVTTSLEPVYALGTAGKVAQDPNGPIKGTFSVDYHINDDPLNKTFDDLTKQSALSALVQPITVKLGDQEFKNAYLTSHGANGQANQLATAKASFDLYFDSTSQAISFGKTGTAGSSSDTGLGHGASTTSSLTAITNATSFSYESTIQYDVIFKLGSILPAAVYISRASKKITVEGYEVSTNITMCGDTANASASVNGLCSNSGTVTYTVDGGRIISAEGSVSAGQVGKGKATVVKFI